MIFQQPSKGSAGLGSVNVEGDTPRLNGLEERIGKVGTNSQQPGYGVTPTRSKDHSRTERRCQTGQAVYER